jgi:hypothetical protein
MLHYYILNSNPHLLALLEFVRKHQLEHEVHLNRTRFWIDPASACYTEFALRYADCCCAVDPHRDLQTGF